MTASLVIEFTPPPACKIKVLGKSRSRSGKWTKQPSPTATAEESVAAAAQFDTEARSLNAAVEQLAQFVWQVQNPTGKKYLSKQQLYRETVPRLRPPISFTYDASAKSICISPST